MPCKNKNILISYFLSFQSELYFPMAIIVFYFLHWLNFTQISVLLAIRYLSQNIFEIPSGAFSDLFGRKNTLVLSKIIYFFGLMVLGFGNSFSIFILGMTLSGLAEALASGTLESLVYDTLKQRKLTQRFDQAISKMESLIWMALFISAIGGGFMYDWWNRLPFLFSAGLYLPGILLCSLLKEPVIDSEKFSVKNYFNQNKQGFCELFASKKRGVFSLMLITVASGYLIAARLLGPSQVKEYGLDGKETGFLFGTGYLIAAVFSMLFPLLRKKLGNANLLVGATGMLIVSFLGANFVGAWLGSVLILLRISSSTTFNNAKSVVVNRLIYSKNRNTALSTLTLLSQLPFVLLSYFIGVYIDNNSPNSFALLLGIVLFILISGQLIVFKRVKKA